MLQTSNFYDANFRWRGDAPPYFLVRRPKADTHSKGNLITSAELETSFPHEGLAYFLADAAIVRDKYRRTERSANSRPTPATRTNNIQGLGLQVLLEKYLLHVPD
jgi:hypothetical protein